MADKTFMQRIEESQPNVFSLILTPPSFNSNQNNYNPAGISTANVLRLTAIGSQNITGIIAGTYLRIINIGASNIVLVNNSALSLAANRFLGTGNLTMPSNRQIDLFYDTVSLRWRIIN